ncbi:hypothetical protein Ancab_011352 [Ancistrocladus abbreviatus]
MPKTQLCNPSNSKLKLICFQGDRASSVPFLKQFSYKDLKRATDGFRRIVSCHSHWVTYEAKFPDGSIALVKEIKDPGQGKDVLYREVQLLGCLHHRHLVALKGYSAGHRSFLVFENTGCGSLKEHLNDPLRTPLSWKTRLHIATGVAAALLSDISLLDSVLYTEEMTHHSCTKDCTDGQCQNLIPQFGALILELITGQSPEKEGADVIQWIQESHFRKSMDNMIDPDLGNSFDPKVMRSLLALARLCIKADANKPPFSISHILCYLQQKVGLLCD